MKILIPLFPFVERFMERGAEFRRGVVLKLKDKNEK